MIFSSWSEVMSGGELLGDCDLKGVIDHWDGCKKNFWRV